MYQVKNTYFPNIVNSFRLLYGRKCKQVKEYLTDNDAAATGWLTPPSLFITICCRLTTGASFFSERFD
jgi:hypothetical protein